MYTNLFGADGSMMYSCKEYKGNRLILSYVSFGASSHDVNIVDRVVVVKN